MPSLIVGWVKAFTRSRQKLTSTSSRMPRQVMLAAHTTKRKTQLGREAEQQQAQRRELKDVNVAPPNLPINGANIASRFLPRK